MNPGTEDVGNDGRRSPCPEEKAMSNGEPAIVRRVQAILERHGVLERIDEIQYATKFAATAEGAQAFILVFRTGTILVQGRHSFLRTWLSKVKASIEDQTTAPDLVLPSAEPSSRREKFPGTTPRDGLHPLPGRTSLFIDLPDATTAHVVGGQKSAEAAPCVDADDVPEVQDCPFELRGVADDGGLP